MHRISSQNVLRRPSGPVSGPLPPPLIAFDGGDRLRGLTFRAFQSLGGREPTLPCDIVGWLPLPYSGFGWPDHHEGSGRVASPPLGFPASSPHLAVGRAGCFVVPPKRLDSAASEHPEGCSLAGPPPRRNLALVGCFRRTVSRQSSVREPHPSIWSETPRNPEIEEKIT